MLRLVISLWEIVGKPRVVQNLVFAEKNCGKYFFPLFLIQIRYPESFVQKFNHLRLPQSTLNSLRDCLKENLTILFFAFYAVKLVKITELKAIAELV